MCLNPNSPKKNFGIRPGLEFRWPAPPLNHPPRPAGGGMLRMASPDSCVHPVAGSDVDPLKPNSLRTERSVFSQGRGNGLCFSVKVEMDAEPVKTKQNNKASSTGTPHHTGFCDLLGKTS